MKRDSDTGISFFQRYLTVWVIICMVLGILIGKYLPSVPAFLNQFEYAKVSIPTLSAIMQNIIDDKSVDVAQGILHHGEGVDLYRNGFGCSCDSRNIHRKHWDWKCRCTNYCSYTDTLPGPLRRVVLRHPNSPDWQNSGQQPYLACNTFLQYQRLFRNTLR